MGSRGNKGRGRYSAATSQEEVFKRLDAAAEVDLADQTDEQLVLVTLIRESLTRYYGHNDAINPKLLGTVSGSLHELAEDVEDEKVKKELERLRAELRAIMRAGVDRDAEMALLLKLLEQKRKTDETSVKRDSWLKLYVPIGIVREFLAGLKREIARAVGDDKVAEAICKRLGESVTERAGGSLEAPGRVRGPEPDPLPGNDLQHEGSSVAGEAVRDPGEMQD